MKIFKPKFWNKRYNVFSFILLPLSLMYMTFITLKKIVIKSKKFNIPVIVVGNIFVGGTGKTPLSIFISKELKNKKTVIIKKYYNEHKDEFSLIKSKSCNLIHNKDRKLAIKEAERKKFDAVILDDGFQDHSILKNINIICFNSNQLIGNGMMLPAGPLRERMNSLNKAQIIMINGKKNVSFEKKILSISKKIKIYYSKYTPININEFKKKKLLAFAGIGNPENFFDILKSNNLNVQREIAFPDHYEFKKTELLKIIDSAKKDNLDIVTTEKDYNRIKDYKFKKIKALKLELKVFKKNSFIKQITNCL